MNQAAEQNHYQEQGDQQTARPVLQPSFRNVDPRRKSAFLATILSFLPGLGQIYVGYYQRGFLFIVIFGSTISILAADAVEALAPLLGIFLAFFWFFNVIDAYRRASMFNMALEGLETIELPNDRVWQGLGGSYVGGIALLVFGAIALSNTLFGMSLRWVEDWWPVAPLAMGAYLVYKAYADQQQKRNRDSSQ